MKEQELKEEKKTWELFYPDGTSSLMNYDPIKEIRKQTLEEVKELQKAYDIALEENNRLRAKRKYWEDKYKKIKSLGEGR